jgi:hypothetical protein
MSDGPNGILHPLQSGARRSPIQTGEESMPRKDIGRNGSPCLSARTALTLTGGDVAADTKVVGFAFYETLIAMHRAVLNLFAAGLFPLFERQAAAPSATGMDRFLRTGRWMRLATGSDRDRRDQRALSLTQ